jgi:glycosidase
MPGGTYHGYATTDYYNIDPRFGTNQEWNNLVDQCHKRGIKVVMDMIFNHSGSEHIWFTDRPSRDWFNFPEGYQQTSYRLSTVYDPYVSNYDRRLTTDGWFVESMPDLNQNNPHLMTYLIQNSIWWIESSKIDGIRMDTHPYAFAQPMAQWIDAVEREYPNYNIVGECWYGTEGGEAYWQRGSKVSDINTNLPTVMDFVLSISARKAFSEQTDPWNGLNTIYDHLALDYLFPNPQKILTFLDNHDTDRFLLEEPQDLGWWKQALTFLLTSRGIPQLYYGTELLMHGKKEGSDGYVRLDFPGGFPGDAVNAFTPEGRTPMQNEAHDFLAKVLNWRKGKANDVIANGTLKHFMPTNGIYLYERRLGDKQVIVMLNGNDNELLVEMDRYNEIMPIGTTMRDMLTGTSITIDEEMTFAPRAIYILENF